MAPYRQEGCQLPMDPQCMTPVPDIGVAYTCLHGTNPFHKAVLRGKKLEKMQEMRKEIR